MPAVIADALCLWVDAQHRCTPETSSIIWQTKVARGNINIFHLFYTTHIGIICYLKSQFTSLVDKTIC